MNKDNKVLLISAVALVAASVGAHFTDKANEGFPTSLPVAHLQKLQPGLSAAPVPLQ